MEAALRTVPGVRDVTVSYDDESARVTVERGRVDPDELQAALERAGYRSWID